MWSAQLPSHTVTILLNRSDTSAFTEVRQQSDGAMLRANRAAAKK